MQQSFKMLPTEQPIQAKTNKSFHMLQSSSLPMQKKQQSSFKMLPTEQPIQAKTNKSFHMLQSGSLPMQKKQQSSFKMLPTKQPIQTKTNKSFHMLQSSSSPMQKYRSQTSGLIQAAAQGVSLRDEEQIFIDPMKLISYLTRNFDVTMEMFNPEEIYNEIDSWCKSYRGFESGEELLDTLFPDDDDEDDNLDDPDFSLSLWPIGEKTPKEILNYEYTKGESVRGDMDYQSTDKGAYAVEENGALVLVIREQKVPNSGHLSDEVATLRLLKTKGIPVAKVIKSGAYVIGQSAYPTMVMKRYVGSSKEIMRQSKGNITNHSNIEENLARLLPSKLSANNAIESLNLIKSKISNKGVNDIQFLIDENGFFVVNDANEMHAKFIEHNILLINALIMEITSYKKGI